MKNNPLATAKKEDAKVSAKVIHVIYRIDGTTKTDVFTAESASITMMRNGRTSIEFSSDATDQDGKSVKSVLYRRAEKVTRSNA